MTRLDSSQKLVLEAIAETNTKEVTMPIIRVADKIAQMFLNLIWEEGLRETTHRVVPQRSHIEDLGIMKAKATISLVTASPIAWVVIIVININKDQIIRVLITTNSKIGIETTSNLAMIIKEGKAIIITTSSLPITLLTNLKTLPTSISNMHLSIICTLIDSNINRHLLNPRFLNNNNKLTTKYIITIVIMYWCNHPKTAI